MLTRKLVKLYNCLIFLNLNCKSTYYPPKEKKKRSQTNTNKLVACEALFTWAEQEPGPFPSSKDDNFWRYKYLN